MKSLFLFYAEFTGWGKTKTEDLEPSEDLNIIRTKIVPLGNCQKSPFGSNAYENHICALAKINVGACDGDSGGPLVWNKKVVGVASFVRPCAKGVPDIFTSVAYYSDWIQKTMDRMVEKRNTRLNSTQE